MNDITMNETAGAEPLLSLREAREAAGLHIAALAAALKVPVKKLEALEAGRYDELPDLTFARALASSACRQLKVDPAPVLQQIPVGHGPQLGEGHQAINTPFKDATTARAFNPAGWLARPAVLIALAVLLAALVLLFLPLGGGQQLEALMPPMAAQTDAEPVADQAAGSSVVVEPGPAASGVAAASTEPASVATGVAAGGQEAAATVPEPSPSTTTSSSTALLSIAASGESWVEVINGQGSTVVQRMLKAGDVLDFSSSPPYNVVIGRADAAQVNVRGKPFDITPYARNSVARFEVK